MRRGHCRPRFELYNDTMVRTHVALGEKLTRVSLSPFATVHSQLAAFIRALCSSAAILEWPAVKPGFSCREGELRRRRQRTTFIGDAQRASDSSIFHFHTAIIYLNVILKATTETAHPQLLPVISSMLLTLD